MDRMDRRSRSIESYRRKRRDSRSRSLESPPPSRHYRRYKRSYDSRSKSRSRSRGRIRRRSRSWSRSRSRSFSRGRRSKYSTGRDLYRDLVEPDYEDYHKAEPPKNYKNYNNSGGKGNSVGGSAAAGETSSYHHHSNHQPSYHRRYNDEKYQPAAPPPQISKERKRRYSPERNDSDESYDTEENHYFDGIPNNTVVIRGLSAQITEADISSDLLQYHLHPLSIRLIRKFRTGASRGFAFVEFSSADEASRWIAYKQGILELEDCKATMQYSHSKEGLQTKEQTQSQKIQSDWYCVCGVFNFKRRGRCFECYAFRETSEATVESEDARATVPYSHSKDEPQIKEQAQPQKIQSDWYCAKCGVFNFKRRENCFKCCASREESEKGGEGSDEVSNILTKKIMLRNLDVLTTEEIVLTTMLEKIPKQVEKITKILICRDPLTQTSRGICYLHFDNLVDSMNTHNALSALEPPLNIEGRTVLVSYCMDTENKIINPSASKYTARSQVTDTSTNYATAAYTLSDVPRLAEYSAGLYASNATEKEQYIKYYTNYYIAEIARGHYENLPNMNQMGESANSGAAVAMSAMQRKMKYDQKLNKKPKGYATGPDTSNYQYDPSSGYYYDPVSTLYYDPNTQYFYNQQTGVYYYYNEQQNYVAVSSNATQAPAVVTTTVSGAISTVEKPVEEEKVAQDSSHETPTQKPSGKQDKVKVAKKIVKDMEKWAKQLNQKKEMSSITVQQPSVAPTPAPMKSIQGLSSGYADIGFSILENKEKVKLEDPSDIRKLATAYNSDSDDHANDFNSNSTQNVPKSESDIVDFAKLTCLLCKRAFQSEDVLQKHMKMSKLHLENLAKYQRSSGVSFGPKGAFLNQEYRDRAKERRLKYGECDPPPVNRSKERFEKKLESLTEVKAPVMPIGENNVGNRLLQKMGWQEGQGLGKSNQGRTQIIEADGRSSQAGLGSKISQFNPGDDYKSYIKRMMKSRYEQVETTKK